MMNEKPKNTEVLTKEIETVASGRYQRLDRDSNRMIEIYGQLINLSQIPKNTSKTRNEKEALQLAVYASEFVNCCEGLLQLCSELKQAYILHDYEVLQRLNEKTWNENQQKERQILETMFPEQIITDKQSTLTELQQYIDVTNLTCRSQVNHPK
jgi:hypothetical protein